MSKFKLPKKLSNNTKTVISYTFDDSVYGHEIKPEWNMSMIDAMWYCQCRAEGNSQAKVEKAWHEYVEQMFNEELW